MRSVQCFDDRGVDLEISDRHRRPIGLLLSGNARREVAQGDPGGNIGQVMSQAQIIQNRPVLHGQTSWLMLPGPPKEFRSPVAPGRERSVEMV